MKKTGIIFLLCTTIFSSCLKNIVSENRSPVKGGVGIFTMANPSNFAALDPVTVCIKLNAILTERTIGQSDKPLGEVRVPGKTTLMCDEFFGTNDASFVEIGLNTGDWKLTFKGMSIPSADYMRRGSIIISTGNKLLQELPSTDYVWTVKNVEDVAYSLISDNNITQKTEFARDYIISGGSVPLSWKIECAVVSTKIMNQTCYNTPYWDFSYQLSQTASDMSYTGLGTAKYKMSGSARGVVPNYKNRDNILIYYDIVSDIRSEARCKIINGWKGPYQAGGAVVITVDDASYEKFDKSYYPSNTTKWVWSEAETDCFVITTVTYNGNTEASSSGNI